MAPNLTILERAYFDSSSVCKMNPVVGGRKCGNLEVYCIKVAFSL